MHKILQLYEFTHKQMRYDDEKKRFYNEIH